MSYTYKLLGNHTEPSVAGQPINCILRKEDGAWIPKDENNTDYQEYLSWLAAGNVPDPAD